MDPYNHHSYGQRNVEAPNFRSVVQVGTSGPAFALTDLLRWLRRAFFPLATSFWLAFAAGSSKAASPFYAGKTMRIIVGASAGGGFDTYSRTIARHLGKHIPGEPTIIVENMPGAGMLIAANYLYKVAKPDGLTVGNFIGYQVLNQILGRPGVEFDARRFEWIGAPSQDNGACALTKASGITSLERWKAAKTPVKLGVVGIGDITYNTAKVLRNLLGLPVQPIVGFKGTAEIRLASESGELAGGCWTWESIKVTWRKALEAGNATVVLQTTPKPHPELLGVPLAMDLAKSEEERILLLAAMHDPNAIIRPYVLPPGTPKDRVQLLRRAFLDTMKDPDFLADTKKSRLDVDPLPGEEVERIVAALFKLGPGLQARLREILK